MPISTILERPAVAHLLRMNSRFNGRLGNQFAAAITYFSVLAIIPIAMVAFALVNLIAGERLDPLIADGLAGLPRGLADQVGPAIQQARDSAGTVGVIGLLTAIYAGAGWVANLKTAVRAMWRPRFDAGEDKATIVVETLKNLGLLIGLLVLVVLSFGFSAAATTLTGTVVRLLGLSEVPGIGVIGTVVAILGSLLVGFALFSYLFWLLPAEPAPRRSMLRGVLAGAVAFGLLQYLTTFLFSVLAGNAAAAVFGPVIVLMAFFNLFARLVLMLASWIATTEQRAMAGQESPGDRAIVDDPAVRVDPATDPHEPYQRDLNPYAAKVAWSRQQRVRIGPEELDVQYPDEQVMVPQTVASRALRIGSVTGWLLGAAAGTGLGAAVTALLRRRR